MVWSGRWMVVLAYLLMTHGARRTLRLSPQWRAPVVPRPSARLAAPRVNARTHGGSVGAAAAESSAVSAAAYPPQVAHAAVRLRTRAEEDDVLDHLFATSGVSRPPARHVAWRKVARAALAGQSVARTAREPLATFQALRETKPEIVDAEIVGEEAKPKQEELAKLKEGGEEKNDDVGDVSAASLDLPSGCAVLRSPGGALLALLGTAHVSEADAALVARVMEELKPTSVVVELDPDRLPRLGLSMEDLGSQVVVPPQEQPRSNPPGTDGFGAALAAPVIRTLVSKAYEALGASGLKGGGDFAAAITAAQASGARIVLADVDSVSTIEAFLLNSARSNPLDLMRRASMVMASTAAGMVGTEKGDLFERGKKVVQSDEFLDRLNEELPEFYDAFLRARDERVARALLAEANRDRGAVIVAVVGAAHVAGIERKLGWERVDGRDEAQAAEAA